MACINLFMGFLRAGLLCFGGGPASIPFIHREAVTRYSWMNDDDFTETVAIANALPGPINTKLAGYIGFKVGGVWGMLAALFAVVLPTAVLMVVLMTALAHFSHYPWVRGMSRAIIPVVGVMLAIMGWQFLALAAKTLKWLPALAHVAVVAVLIGVLSWHPAIVLAALFAWAFFGHKFLRKKDNQP